MSVWDQGWRLLALSASLLIHFYLFMNWSDKPLISARENELPPNALFVQIQFPQPQPEAQMPVEEPPPPEPEKKPEPPPKPKPKPKPKPVAKPKPKPVERPPEPEQVVETQVESVLPPPPTASRENVDLRNEFISRVLAIIEKNKFYPTIARRRNLQGVVQVRFRLGCDGKVEGVEIEGKHSLLRKAAGKAVDASLPLPKIPHEIKCPMLIDYAMAYSLEK